MVLFVILETCGYNWFVIIIIIIPPVVSEDLFKKIEIEMVLLQISLTTYFLFLDSFYLYIPICQYISF